MFQGNSASNGDDIFMDSGSVTVNACPAGHTSNQGASLDTSGTIGGTLNIFTCSVCEGGKYATAGATTCDTCEAGKYATAGATTCDTCEAGRYSSEGSGTCTECEASKFSIAVAAFCVSCVAGKAAENGGTPDEICEDCVAGRYSPGEFFSDIEFLAGD